MAVPTTVPPPALHTEVRDSALLLGLLLVVLGLGAGLASLLLLLG